MEIYGTEVKVLIDNSLDFMSHVAKFDSNLKTKYFNF